MGNTTGVHVDDIIIRQAVEDDVDRIGELWKRLVTHHRLLDEQLPEAAEDGDKLYAHHILNRLEDQLTRVFVAEVDGQVVGYVFGIVVDLVPEMFIAEPGGFLADIYVDEKYRGKGIGRDLVDALTKWFRARGVAYVELYVANKNDDARDFWDKIGAKDLMTRVRFKI